MADLTMYEALMAELEPYAPNALTVKKALMDEGLDAEGPYQKESNAQIGLASIAVLIKMKVLQSESVGKTSQSYSVSKIDERIRAICKKHGFNEADYIEDLSSISDGSDLW